MDEDEELREQASQSKAKNTLNAFKSRVVGAAKFIFAKFSKIIIKWVAIASISIIGFVVLFNTFEKVIFSNVVDIVKAATGTKEGETIDFATSEFIKIVDYKGTYCIKIDKKLIEKIEENLKKEKIDAIDLNLEDFECFKEFIVAEIVTQYPNLGSLNGMEEDGDGNIYTDGIIDIKRKEPNDKKAKLLTYLPPNRYSKLCSENDKKALEHFSLDSNRQLIIAGYDEMDVKVSTEGDTSITQVPGNEHSYTITTKNIDYLSIVKKYTMPFALQLAILQTSDSVDMALDFSKLAQDSQMTITIEDEIETSKYEEKRSIEQHIEGNKTISYTISQVNNPTEETAKAGGITYTDMLETGPETITADKQGKSCTVNVNTTVTTNNPKVELTEVDCWIAKFKRTYTHKKKVEKSTDTAPENKEEEKIQPSINDADVIAYVKSRRLAHTVTAVEGYNSYITSSTSEVASTDLKRVTTTKSTTNITTTTKTFTSTKTKTESNEEKIFEIFKNNSQAYGSLKDAQDWFYGLLESEESTVDFIDIMKYLINKFDDPKYKGKLDLDPYDLEDFENTGAGSSGVFGCNLSRDEFIKKCKNYKKNDSTYQKNMASYAGVFYDVCTKSQYNVNPCLAYAHACLETGSGSSTECQTIYNYFGMAHGNTSSSGRAYSSVEESVEDYCKWIIDHGTPGKNGYKTSAAVGKKYAKYNKSFSGDPSTNAYDLYSIYAFLGNTHVTSNADYTAKWGDGGRTYTRIIYGGYNYSSKTWKDKAKYDTKCGNNHPNASDKTTTAEQADYAKYAMDQRINILTAIFGEEALLTGGSGGEYKASGGVVLGTFTSDITGKTFKIYNQCAISGWGGYCNRATAIAIASAYTNKTDNELISLANSASAKPLSSGLAGTQIFFNRFGLQASGGMFGGENYTATMKKNLQSGKYAALHVVGSGYKGKSGKTWASTTGAMHWVSILGYKNEKGKDKIFVGDPGHGNTGWYDIDEFVNGTGRVDMLYYIWPKK